MCRRKVQILKCGKLVRGSFTTLVQGTKKLSARGRESIACFWCPAGGMKARAVNVMA